MREDIKLLLENRASWILVNDQEYQDILAAIDYARKGNNHSAVIELEQMLEARQKQLLCS
jgi:hypothetical protein